MRFTRPQRTYDETREPNILPEQVIRAAHVT